MIFFILSLCINLHASQFMPKEDKLPLEIVFLLKNLNEIKLSAKEDGRLVEHVKDLNRNLKFITKEKFYFVVKSEIYKNILEKEFQGDFKIMKFTSEQIKTIEESYIKNKDQYSLFSRYLIESILSDFNTLKTYPGFNQVKLNSIDRDPTLNLIRKKLNLLSPWLGAMSTLEARDFNLRMKRLMLKIIEDLASITGVYKTYMPSEELEKEDFIIVKTISEKKLPIKNSNNEIETKSSDLESQSSIADDLSQASEEESKKAQEVIENISPQIAPIPEVAATPQAWTPPEDKKAIPQAPNWDPKE